MRPGRNNLEVMKEEIMLDVKWLMFHCFILGFALCLLMWNNWPSKSKKDKSNFEESDTEKLHCFDCEIEMPVKVKNGRTFCSNCGLPH